jgi:hypothetical protein
MVIGDCLLERQVLFGQIQPQGEDRRTRLGMDQLSPGEGGS